MIVWFLIVFSPWSDSSVVIPVPYPTQEKCVSAASQTVPIRHERGVIGFCVPAEIEKTKERIGGE